MAARHADSDVNVDPLADAICRDTTYSQEIDVWHCSLLLAILAAFF